MALLEARSSMRLASRFEFLASSFELRASSALASAVRVPRKAALVPGVYRRIDRPGPAAELCALIVCERLLELDSGWSADKSAGLLLVAFAPLKRFRGMSWSQNIVKYGWAILLADGRFNQIWNSSSLFGPF